MVYQPMLELLAYLRANGFKTFIVSGGGIEFMRPWTEKVYGIPPEQVVGSSGKLKFEMRDGKPVLVKLPAVDLIDDKEGKPVGIQSHIGRRPIAAFGNSDGDLQMLQWTTAGSGPRFALIVHHTDAEREWAYDRNSHVGKLDKALDEAVAEAGPSSSMKDDWKTIFAGDGRGRKRFLTGSAAQMASRIQSTTIRYMLRVGEDGGIQVSSTSESWTVTRRSDMRPVLRIKFLLPFTLRSGLDRIAGGMM